MPPPTTTTLTQPKNLKKRLIDGLRRIQASQVDLPLVPLNGNKQPLGDAWQKRPFSASQLIDAIENGGVEVPIKGKNKQLQPKGFGVLTGRPIQQDGQTFYLMALDQDGPAAASKIKELSGGQPLPSTVAFTSGRPGRCQYLFLIRGKLFDQVATRRIKTEVKGEQLEFRLNNAQSVLPPSVHPQTGQYQWVDGAAIDQCDMAIAPEWITQTMSRSVEKTQTTATKATKTPSVPTTRFKPLNQEKISNWSDTDRALSYLDSLSSFRADDYDEWLKVGMALHSVDDSLLNDWDKWSQQSAKYEPGDCEKKWRSFSSEKSVGLGTLGYLAKQDGWQSPFKGKKMEPIKSNLKKGERVQLTEVSPTVKNLKNGMEATLIEAPKVQAKEEIVKLQADDGQTFTFPTKNLKQVAPPQTQNILNNSGKSVTENPITWDELINGINQEMSRIGWEKEQGKQHLLDNYGVDSRLKLSDEQILEFHDYLKAQPTVEKPKARQQKSTPVSNNSRKSTSRFGKLIEALEENNSQDISNSAKVFGAAARLSEIADQSLEKVEHKNGNNKNTLSLESNQMPLNKPEIKKSQNLIAVKKLVSDSNQQFDKNLVEQNAQAMIELGGLVKPLVVRREGDNPLNEMYRVDPSSAFELAVARRAKEIDPRAAETVNAWIIENPTEEKAFKTQTLTNVAHFNSTNVSVSTEKSSQKSLTNVSELNPISPSQTLPVTNDSPKNTMISPEQNKHNQKSASDVQKVSQEAALTTTKLLKKLLDRLQNNKKLSQQMKLNFSQPVNVKIDLDGKEVFLGKDSTPQLDNLSKNDLNYLNKALDLAPGKAPDDFQRNLTIKVNDQEIFKLQDGVVSVNELTQQKNFNEQHDLASNKQDDPGYTVETPQPPQPITIDSSPNTEVNSPQQNSPGYTVETPQPPQPITIDSSPNTEVNSPQQNSPGYTVETPQPPQPITIDSSPHPEVNSPQQNSPGYTVETPQPPQPITIDSSPNTEVNSPQQNSPGYTVETPQPPQPITIDSSPHPEVNSPQQNSPGYTVETPQPPQPITIDSSPNTEVNSSQQNDPGYTVETPTQPQPITIDSKSHENQVTTNNQENQPVVIPIKFEEENTPTQDNSYLDSQQHKPASIEEGTQQEADNYSPTINVANNQQFSSQNSQKNPLLSSAKAILDSVKQVSKNLSQQLGQIKDSIGQRTNKINNSFKNLALQQKQSGNKKDLNNVVALAAATRLLENFGDKNNQGSRIFEGNTFRFESNNSNLKITAKDGRGEVLTFNKGNLQGNLTDTDVKQFQKINSELNKLVGQRTKQQNKSKDKELALVD